ncbi:MAG: hypothetical protein D6806_06020 [Deltaproteobacteria bacterium]|nr:MAG: hypothetical protein D6806_06020 [Deltaproteobacteria bacterium]
MRTATPPWSGKIIPRSISLGVPLEAERGNSYVILRRGKPVARLVPVETDAVGARRQAIEAMQSLRKQIEGKFDVCRLVERERM